jgi:hypothetical protein
MDSMLVVSSHSPLRPHPRYYWVLDPQLRTLEVLQLGSAARHRVALACSGGRVRAPGCPGLILNLDDLWAEVDEIERRQGRRRKK